MIEVLLGFPFALVGLWLAYAGVQEYRSQRAMLAGRKRVPAQVTGATVEERQHDGGGTYFVPVVSYRYELDGETYESDRVLPPEARTGYPYSDPAWDVVSRYEDETTVAAYVDPAAPSVAFLEPDGMRRPLLFAGFGVALTVLTGLYAIALALA
ncbi:DUF3592 domain-containing protein [Haloarchaeobius sp. TZWSO28]|uniref:DUF3592 domain-containing protein n=1 Tax=Haloarchaeobius sp. TZWSO28 TaxID=3446119 RepID=UPI003EBBDF44